MGNDIRNPYTWEHRIYYCGFRYCSEIGVFGVVLFLIACLLGAGLTGYHKALYDIEHKNEPQSVEKVMGGK